MEGSAGSFTPGRGPNPRGPLSVSSDLPLGQAEGACKECRRRKAKCDRAIPTCSLCTKYRRHCLYEKHSRTPLTRKYLTEVEERLERSEALIKQMRSLLPAHLQGGVSSLNSQQQQSHTEEFNFANLDSGATISSDTSSEQRESQIQPIVSNNDQANEGDSHDTGFVMVADSPPASMRRQKRTSISTNNQRLQLNQFNSSQGENSRGPLNPLENPPSTEDFSWDEQETTMRQRSLSPDAINDSEDGPPILDGMASLTVNESEAGYLGVASGAALLRILEPTKRRSSQARPSVSFPSQFSLSRQLDVNRHIADAMIDAYFRTYHLSYPIIHEPTFRAQFSQVIPRPHGDSWLVLAYVVAALGVFTTATSLNNLDLALFSQAKSVLSFDFLEVGNLTLVQALTLISNYQQKRDKPNSGYNYLGLAVRMAMGLGLHKEFQGWNISPLNMEIRRRVWWSLCVFDVGATITFSRPDNWPYDGVEVALPKNVNDRELTPVSHSYPPDTNDITPYTAVRTQASFHLATNPIYARVISKPFPTAAELLQLEKDLLEPWVENIPGYFSERAQVPTKYHLAHAVMQWRYRNFRIIMYRPFVIRRALLDREGRRGGSPTEDQEAYDRCLVDAEVTITSINQFWSTHSPTRLGAWYALYFLFQAVLIPCICLRNDPLARQSQKWREQISTTLRTIAAFAPVHPSASRSHEIITELCGRYLNHSVQPAETSLAQPQQSDVGTGIEGIEQFHTGSAQEAHDPFNPDHDMGPIDESPQTQINNVFTMMWPNLPPLEAVDLAMSDDAWAGFLYGSIPETE